MALLSGFFDANLENGIPDRQYDATAWAQYFNGFIGNGVVEDTFQVTAGSGLSVIVNPGMAYINGYFVNNTEPLTINIDSANSTYPRLTSVILELSLNNREIICTTVDGTAQNTPSAPQLTQTPSLFQIQLATVLVPAGSTSIATITDTRGLGDVCGWMSINAPTQPPTAINACQINGGVVVEENGGSINYNNASGTNIITQGVAGNQYAVTNTQTNNNLISVTPGTSGTDTVDVDANIDFNEPITVGNANGVMYFQNSSGANMVALNPNDNTLELVNELTGTTIASVTPVASGTDTVDVDATINLENGLEACGTNLVQYENIPFSVLISPGIAFTGNCIFWLVNAPNLTGTTANGAIGIMTVTGSINGNYYWPTDNNFPVGLAQIPNMTAITQTPSSAFQVGASTGTLYLKGNNQNLNAGTTYTVQALAFQ